ncbi:MAG TPA: cytochrome c3 family protein, partial [Planctomycetota bacterium]|nr:cytochrome c3 family protein [Planctomycetota bacterium]
MTLLFPKWTNKLPQIIGAAVLAGGGLVTFVVGYWFSPRHTDVGYAPEQPVPYSHKLHAGLLGLDCRYCHQNVEGSPHASIPDTNTCMNCHAQVRKDSPNLEVLRQSFENGTPVPWVKVHMLPQYAYFNHEAHVRAGVGCASCHGRVDKMDVVRQVEPLSMSWCLDCHREPENHLRPADRVTDMEYVHDLEVGRKLKLEKNINPPTHCSGCHR